MDLSTIVGGLQTLPIGIQHRLNQAAGSLIGALTKVPKAWIEETAQDIKAEHSSRRALEKAAVAAAKRYIDKNDEIALAVIEARLPASIRKSRNSSRVLFNAGEAVTNERDAISHSDKGDHPIDDDWLNVFSRQAEDASSDRMQQLLGKILAGEIRSPGRFSLTTLRVVAEMDQQTASDVQKLAEHSLDERVFLDDSWRTGDKLDLSGRWLSAGLVTSGVDQLASKVVIMGMGVGLLPFGYTHIRFEGPPNAELSMPVLVLTRTGQQLAQILPSTSKLSLTQSVAKLMRDKYAFLTNVTVVVNDGGQEFQV